MSYRFDGGVENPRNHKTLSHYHLCMEIVNRIALYKDYSRQTQKEVIETLLNKYDVVKRKSI